MAGPFAVRVRPSHAVTRVPAREAPDRGRPADRFTRIAPIRGAPFNTALLGRAGVTPPGDGYTLAAFLDDLGKVKASGATPLCLGGKDPFTTVELFENVLLSTIRTDGWRDMVADDLNWRSTRVQTALRSFGDMLAYADPEASGLTWDAATKKLTTGGCAFESMNDSAYGELVAGGAREGTDFGAVAFPGTGGSFLAVVDVFVAATRAENAKNALAFLGGIGAAPTQVAFSRAKGSIPVWRTVDVSSLPAYQQASAKTFWTAPVLLSIAHGEAMSPRFQEGFYEAVSTYVRDPRPGRLRRQPGERRLPGADPAPLRAVPAPGWRICISSV